MMMMTSINDIKKQLSTNLGEYRKLKIMDAVLQNNKTTTQTYDTKWTIAPLGHTSSSKDGYDYASTKLAEITKQKAVQFEALASVLKEIEKDGTVQKSTLQASAGLVGLAETPTSGNDDRTMAVTKNKAEVVADFGLKDLITSKEISKEDKQKLASAYLTQIKALNAIQDDSAKPNFENTTATTDGPVTVLKEYATLKKEYIDVVKKGLEDKIIEATDDEIDAATFSNEKPNQKFDPQYKTYTGGVKDGTPDADKVAKSEKIAKVKEKLDGIRQRFKEAGIDNVDDLLQADKFEPAKEKEQKIANLTDEQKKKITGTSQTDNGDVWRPIATKVKTILEEQTKNNGNKQTAGVTLENFTNKILGDEAITEKLTTVYNANSGKPATNIDNIFNTKEVKQKDAQGKETGRSTTVTEKVAGAEDANRETALAKIKPIVISTNKDFGGGELQGTVTVNDKAINISLGNGEVPIYNEDNTALAISDFRGQPAVLSKKGNRYFVRFFDVQKVGNENKSSVVTTAIAEIDPKLAFVDKEFKIPKESIDYDMIVPDKKRRIVDYYIRGYRADGSTDSNKVLYVARNFSDSIDRLPAIRAAQYWARKSADPEFYPDTPTSKEKPEKSAEPIDVPIPGTETPVATSTNVVKVERKS
jgi:hypothetical protein